MELVKGEKREIVGEVESGTNLKEKHGYIAHKGKIAGVLSKYYVVQQYSRYCESSEPVSEMELASALCAAGSGIVVRERSRLRHLDRSNSSLTGHRLAASRPWTWESHVGADAPLEIGAGVSAVHNEGR